MYRSVVFSGHTMQEMAQPNVLEEAKEFQLLHEGFLNV